MFKKLLSNLPFNPSLIGQLAFYAKRIHQESSIRRIGMIFVSLAMVIQVFAVFSPPESSVQASPNNDLINGGFTTQAQAVSHCQKNDQNYAQILAHYNISCDNIAKASQVPLNSRDHGGKLFSMGRMSYGKTGEQPVNIPNVGTFWLRYLWSWDTGSSSNYKALSGTSSKGLKFFILFNCGNLVFTGIPPVTPPSPPPAPPAPPPKPTPPATPTPVPPKSTPPSPTPVTPATPTPPPTQVLSCSNLVMNVPDGSKVKLGSSVIVRGQASGQNIKSGQKVDMYYDYVNTTTNKVVSSAKSSGVGFSGTAADDANPPTFTASEPGQYTIRLTVKYDSTTVASGSASGNCLKSIDVQKACEASQSSEDLTSCLEIHKTAKNSTQNIANANGTQAKGGDVIDYTLSVTNSGNVTVTNFIVQENISDILDYADIVDLHGGKMDDKNIVSWPKSDIKSKQTITKQITVNIKNPIPNTPVSSSDPGHFDCMMTNVYGDTTNIKLSPTQVCILEKVGSTLPNTGPGQSLTMGFVGTVIVGYFFARSRLIAKELDIVRAEYTTTGGD